MVDAVRKERLLMKIIVEAEKRELQETMGGCFILTVPNCQEFTFGGND